MTPQEDTLQPDTGNWVRIFLTRDSYVLLDNSRVQDSLCFGRLCSRVGTHFLKLM